MAKQIGEDTKVTLDLKTIGVIAFFIATVVGMWFSLHQKKVPPTTCTTPDRDWETIRKVIV